MFSTNDKRAMNQGFGDGMSRAFELVATPMVFGGLGYLVDRLAGTSPVFLVVLAAFGVVGTFARVWYGYDTEMRSLESSGRWARRDAAPVLVSANFAAAAGSLAWAARINLGALMGVALFGYLIRISLLFGAVLLLRDLDWVHVASLGCTIVVTHLGLLAWELRYVSASLAHPALKPAPRSPKQ